MDGDLRSRQLEEIKAYVLACRAPEPDDLYQEVCLQACLLTVNWTEPQSRLLKRITASCRAQQWRKTYRRRRLEVRLEQRCTTEQPVGCHEAIERRESIAKLWGAMARLQKTDRDVIERVDLHGATLQQLANQLGSNFRTVQSRHKRALDRLRVLYNSRAVQSQHSMV